MHTPQPLPPLAAAVLCLADCYEGVERLTTLREEAKVLACQTRLAHPACHPLDAPRRTGAERGVRALRSAMRSLEGVTRASDLSRALTRWLGAVCALAAADREAALFQALRTHAEGRDRLEAMWHAKLAAAAGDVRDSPFERVEQRTLALELHALEVEVRARARALPPLPPHPMDRRTHLAATPCPTLDGSFKRTGRAWTIARHPTPRLPSSPASSSPLLAALPLATRLQLRARGPPLRGDPFPLPSPRTSRPPPRRCSSTAPPPKRTRRWVARTVRTSTRVARRRRWPQSFP